LNNEADKSPFTFTPQAAHWPLSYLNTVLC